MTLKKYNHYYRIKFNKFLNKCEFILKIKALISHINFKMNDIL